MTPKKPNLLKSVIKKTKTVRVVQKNLQILVSKKPIWPTWRASVFLSSARRGLSVRRNFPNFAFFLLPNPELGACAPKSASTKFLGTQVSTLYIVNLSTQVLNWVRKLNSLGSRPALAKPSGACFSAKTVVYRGWQNLSSPLCLSLLALLRENWGVKLNSRLLFSLQNKIYCSLERRPAITLYQG